MVALRVVILGGGRIGSWLAKLLRNDKHEVVIIEKDLEEAEKISKELDVLVLQGEGTSRRVLLDADIKSSDCLIAATGDDKVNMLTCEIAKRYGVSRTVSRVTNPENYEIFMDLDIVPINESLIVAESLRKALHPFNKHHTIATIADGRAEVVRYVVRETSKALDKSVRELGLAKNVVCVDRGGEVILPDEKTTLSVGDVLYYVTATGEGERIKSILKDGE